MLSQRAATAKANYRVKSGFSPPLQAKNQQKQAKIGKNRHLTHKNLWKTGINP
jgi:hypothetical protein